MKIYVFLLFMIIAHLGCKESKYTKVNAESNTNVNIDSIQIPNVLKEKSELQFDHKKSLWTFESRLFSGYAVSYFPNKTLMEKIGILNGQKHNKSLTWYADGQLRRSANYMNGKLHGEKKSWSPDALHVLVSHLNYKGGKLHGLQKKWYPTGEIFKVLNLKNGKEEGMQKGYRKNGVLYANYEARESRIFGLKKAALCYGLDDEKIQYEK